MKCYICGKKIEKDFYLLNRKKICISCGDKIKLASKIKIKRIVIGT